MTFASTTPSGAALHILPAGHTGTVALLALQDFFDTHAGGTTLLQARIAKAARDVASGKACAILIVADGQIVAASLGYRHANGTYEIGSVLVDPTHEGKGHYKAMRTAHLEQAGTAPVFLFSRCEPGALKGFTEMSPWDPIGVMNMAHKATHGMAATPCAARRGFRSAIGTEIAFYNDNDDTDRFHRDAAPSRTVPNPG